MMTITIKEYLHIDRGPDGKPYHSIDGSISQAYFLTVTGAGRQIAVIDGVAGLQRQFGSELAVLSDGNAWCLRDVVTKAQRGEMGLRLISDVATYRSVK